MLVVCFSLSQVPAHSIIHFYETGVATGAPIAPESAQAGHVLQNYLAEFPHPPQWTYIIVCDDRAWDNVMHLDGMDDIGRDVFGTTSLKFATTVPRGLPLTGKATPAYRPRLSLPTSFATSISRLSRRGRFGS